MTILCVSSDDVTDAAGRLVEGPRCTEPATWTVQTNHENRTGVDVEMCARHALERVTRSLRSDPDPIPGDSWGAVVSCELVRLLP
jgi:hypothetical protein